MTTTPWPTDPDDLTTRQRVAEALLEDLLDEGRSREDAAYVVRQRWRGYDVDEPRGVLGVPERGEGVRWPTN